MSLQKRDDRKTILARIRKALKVPAPKPTSDSPSAKNQLPMVGQESFEPWLPPAGEDWNENMALFARHSAVLKTEFVLCESEDELQERLAALKEECDWKQVASHQGELTGKVLSGLALPCLFTDEVYETAALEKADVGITQCEALIAQTGTVLITNQSSGGRALSVLVPHHVVIARRKQLLPDLPAAFHFLQEKYADDYPTMLSFITGPSRTGDIERILVLGAHGPKRLTVFCF